MSRIWVRDSGTKSPSFNHSLVISCSLLPFTARRMSNKVGEITSLFGGAKKAIYTEIFYLLTSSVHNWAVLSHWIRCFLEGEELKGNATLMSKNKEKNEKNIMNLYFYNLRKWDFNMISYKDNYYSYTLINKNDIKKFF